jgi:hypothetical protein
VATVCNCRRLGSATSMPSRVTNTGRRSRIDPTAVRALSASHANATTKVMVKSVPWLRSAGIKDARGRLVAVTEDHCVPRPDWCARLLDAQRKTGWVAVGGGVENASPHRLVDWAVYFCEYSQHLHPVGDGPATAIPGMNVAYDMEALADLTFLFERGMWENFIHDELRGAGHRTGLASSVVVGHQKYFTIPMFLLERFHYSRSYAGMRVAGQSLAKRAAWAVGSPALPPLLTIRITRNVVRNRRHLHWFVRSLPLVVLFSGAWAVGECWGYLTGPGDSILKVR